MPDTSPVYTVPQMHDGHAPVLQAMLQTMLAERFKLTVHREMKEMPVIRAYGRERRAETNVLQR
jgi:hypothetical protein